MVSLSDHRSQCSGRSRPSYNTLVEGSSNLGSDAARGIEQNKNERIANPRKVMKKPCRFVDPLGVLSGSDDDDAPKTPSSDGKGKARIYDIDDLLARSLFTEESVNGLTQFTRLRGESKRSLLLNECRATQCHASEELDVISNARDIDVAELRELELSGLVTEPEGQRQVVEAILSPPQHTEQKFCLSCTESKPTSVILKCGHVYCKDCLKTMFDANVNDEYRFPPRCCRQFISVDHLRDVLPKGTLALYNAKTEEYSTPHRLYCSNKTCTRFLGPRQSQPASITCTTCNSSTCAHCTASAHPTSVRCTIDRDLRQALVLGQSHGWQRCPQCRQLVEKNTGCMHMSCRCGAQFCYRCSIEWNKCSCSSGRVITRLLGMAKWKKGRNYLLRGELVDAKSENMLARLCRRSWRGVVGAVGPKNDIKTNTGTVEVTFG